MTIATNFCHPDEVTLRAVPDLFPVGTRVVVYPDVVGVVIEVRGSRRLVRADAGADHEVAVSALRDDVAGERA